MRQKERQKDNSLRPNITVRRYQVGEEADLQTIYSKSTRELNSRHYTTEQIDRWVDKHSNLAEWTERLKKKNPFVAVIDEIPIAFGELEPDGHIDLFYCHPDWQGRGAGSWLMNVITIEALKIGIKTLFAEVSVTAEPFFSKKGFKITEERSPIICSAPAKQYLMRKDIG